MFARKSEVGYSEKFEGGAQCRRVLFFVCLVIMMIAFPAFAETEGGFQSKPQQFDIPAGDLQPALKQFSDQTGIQLQSPPNIEDLKTRGVKGMRTPEEALRMLLIGTGVKYWLTASDRITLKKMTTLKQVVVSATRKETPVSELTRSVTVITREEIDKLKRIDRNVGEILSKTTPGFSPSTEALTNFGQTLRGRKFLTLIDNVPQTTPMRDSRRALNTIDADAIERIEVVRGGSPIYGFGATGGLINIITRRPEEGTINGHSEGGFKLSTTHPNDSIEWHTNHSANGRINEFDYLVSGTFVQRNSFFDADGDRIPAEPFGIQGGLADTDEFNILGKFGYEFDSNRQRIQLAVNHFNIFQDSEWAGVSFAGNLLTGQKTPALRGNPNIKNPGTETTTVNLEYSHEDLYGSKVKAQVYHNDQTVRFANAPAFFFPFQNQLDSEKTGARLTVDTPVDKGPLPFNAVWGMDYLHDLAAFPAINGPDRLPEMEQDAIAGFIDLEVPIGERFLFRGGIRHEAIWIDVDDVTNFFLVNVQGGTLDFSKTLFSASGVYFITEDVETFASFSQGFSVGDIGNAISVTTSTQAKALESEVQTVDNYELGVRARGNKWDASLTGFFSESDNGTTFSPSLAVTLQPEEIFGLEFAVNAYPLDNLRLGGTFSAMEGRVDLNGDGDMNEDLPSTRVPPMKVTGYVEHSPYPWWTNRFQTLVIGNRNPNSTQFGNRQVKSYAVFDLFSSFDTGYGRLDVGIENFFNNEYFPLINQAAGDLGFGVTTAPGFTQAPGRTVSLTYSMDW